MAHANAAVGMLQTWDALLRRTPKAWFGLQPQALLNKYTELCCCRKLPRYRVTPAPGGQPSTAAAAVPEQPDNATAAKAATPAPEAGGSAPPAALSSLIATVSVHPAGHESALEATAEVAELGGPAQIDVAKQQAALDVLHQLQGLFLGLLRPALPHEDAGGGTNADLVSGPQQVRAYLTSPAWWHQSSFALIASGQHRRKTACMTCRQPLCAARCTAGKLQGKLACMQSRA